MSEFKEKYGPWALIAGGALDQLPNTQSIEAMAQHAITKFLGGSPPDQFIE